MQLALGSLITVPAIAVPAIAQSHPNNSPNTSQPLPVTPNAVLVPLPPTELAKFRDGLYDDLFAGDRPSLLAAIDNSLRYLRSPSAAKRYPVAGISRDRAEKSLLRFRELASTLPDARALHEAILRDFVFYKTVGFDGRGTVQFTGYYEAVYDASRTPSKEFPYPLYRMPQDFAFWQSPHPARGQLEGSPRMKGQELIWLRDRLQAFLIHVQGSARLTLPDNTVVTVGYAGKTDRPYTSIGKELVKDGKLKLEEVTLQRLIAYFQQHPQELVTYLNRNENFVFFRETFGKPATGSLGVPVTAERSIATDKSLMPPGALAFMRAAIPFYSPVNNSLAVRSVNRFVLDQDTGGAIRGAGRVDIFMGTGQIPKERAGLLNAMGELYYLVLR